MNKFEVGKTYECYQTEFSPITVTKRTPSFIYVVDNNQMHWRMKIRKNQNGSEFAFDSSAPTAWKDAFTYSSDWEVE